MGSLTAGSLQMSPALEAVVARLRADQSADGMWRTPYLGSAGHTAIGLLATASLAVEANDAGPEVALALALARDQRADGAWTTYGHGADSPSATRLVAAALGTVRARYREQLGTEPDNLLALAVARANAYLAHRTWEQDPFWALLADSAVGATGVVAGVEDLIGPIAAFGAWGFLQARAFRGIRKDLSAFTEEALPSLALLAASPRRTAASFHVRWPRALLRTLERPALEHLARRVEAVQNPNGSWLWSVFGTAINVFALVQGGRSATSEQVVRGLSFIRSLRRRTSELGWQQSWCNAELWDTSVAGMLLLSMGVGGEELKAEAIAERFLAEQRPQSLWAFGAGARRGDHDSTSIAVSFLFRLVPRLAKPLSTRTFDAARAAALSLIATQQSDGGWGYSPSPSRAPYGFGRRVPFGLETAAVDASTADVSGRVLASLAAAEAAGALAGHESQLAEVRRRAVAFYEGSQHPCGSWFGRWSAGYLLSANYVAPVLRTLGARQMSARLRAFLAAHQNADGGFGETPEADVDETQAGVGPSTPVHTAYAVVGLVATAPANDTQQDRALARACVYLEEAAARPSLNADRPLYTVAFREDYYDAPRLTDASVLTALLYAARARDLGVDAATQELVAGIPPRR